MSRGARSVISRVLGNDRLCLKEIVQGMTRRFVCLVDILVRVQYSLKIWVGYLGINNQYAPITVGEINEIIRMFKRRVDRITVKMSKIEEYELKINV